MILLLSNHLFFLIILLTLVVNVEATACDSNPCKNGAKCSNGNSGFICECTPQFTGRFCERDVDECSMRPFVCENGGSCVNQNGGYMCICTGGWTGKKCTKNIDDCAVNACFNGATCHDRVGYFYCECPPGKFGMLCHLDDGCASNPCHPSATCDTSIIDGSFICTCPRGLKGKDCMEDINECQLSSSICEHGGRCVNTVGSFKCDCGPGFTGDRCETDVNECDSMPCLNSVTCLDYPGGYRCICPFGYTGAQCEEKFNNSNAEDDEYVTSVSNYDEPEETTSSSDPNASFLFYGLIAVVLLILVIIFGSLVLLGKNKHRTKIWFPEEFRYKTLFSNTPQARASSSDLKDDFRPDSQESQLSSEVRSEPETDVIAFDDKEIPWTDNGNRELPDTRQWSDLHYAAFSSDDRIGELLKGTQESVDVIGPDGLTPLMVASSSRAKISNCSNEAEAENATFIKELCKRKCSLTLSTDTVGETALHLAARFKRTSEVKQLVDAGANCNAEDFSGRTPLHTAIAAESLPVLKILMNNRTTGLNHKTKDGTTPLILATRLCCYEMIAELLSANAEVNEVDGKGKSALHWAALINDVDAINILLEYGAHINASDELQQTPLFLAVKEGSTKACNLLLSRKADVNTTDNVGQSIFEIAETYCHPDIVRLLEPFLMNKEDIFVESNKSRSSSISSTRNKYANKKNESKKRQPKIKCVQSHQQLKSSTPSSQPIQVNQIPAQSFLQTSDPRIMSFNVESNGEISDQNFYQFPSPPDSQPDVYFSTVYSALSQSSLQPQSQNCMNYEVESSGLTLLSNQTIQSPSPFDSQPYFYSEPAQMSLQTSTSYCNQFSTAMICTPNESFINDQCLVTQPVEPAHLFDNRNSFQEYGQITTSEENMCNFSLFSEVSLSNEAEPLRFHYEQQQQQPYFYISEVL